MPVSPPTEPPFPPEPYQGETGPGQPLPNNLEVTVSYQIGQIVLSARSFRGLLRVPQAIALLRRYSRARAQETARRTLSKLEEFEPERLQATLDGDGLPGIERLIGGNKLHRAARRALREMLRTIMAELEGKIPRTGLLPERHKEVGISHPGEISRRLRRAEVDLRIVRRQREENRQRLINTQVELREYRTLNDLFLGELAADDVLRPTLLRRLLEACQIAPEEALVQAYELWNEVSPHQLTDRVHAAWLIAQLDPTPSGRKTLGLALAEMNARHAALDVLGDLIDSADLSPAEAAAFARLRRPREGGALSDLRLDLAMDRWVRALADKSLIRFALYADIRLNAGDGSSVWLESMATMLAGIADTVLILKHPLDPRSALARRFKSLPTLHLIGPESLSSKLDIIEPPRAIELIRLLDQRLPRLQQVIVRGLAVAEALHSDKQFHRRTSVYLTDFYQYGDDEIIVEDAVKRTLQWVLPNCAHVLVQTSFIAEHLTALFDQPLPLVEIPPVVPNLPVRVSRASEGDSDGVLKPHLSIGYAGKVTPDWGLTELIDWAEKLRRDGLRLELHLALGRLSNKGVRGIEDGFVLQVRERLQQDWITLYEGLDREAAIALMARMDYTWCYRPARLEEHTIEFSTKLAEQIASGVRALCYPGPVNRAYLGEDYPFFMGSFEDLKAILAAERTLPPSLVETVRKRHSLDGVQQHLAQALRPSAPPLTGETRISFAGHDLKFLFPFISAIKAQGGQACIDSWDWGSIQNAERSMALAHWADVVFCEWGLANAVWHAQQKPMETRLVVRVHAQEVRERARRFGRTLIMSSIDSMVFVSATIRDEAKRAWQQAPAHPQVIPNFVQDDLFALRERSWQSPITLGMLGIVPQLKRLDRALDLLAALGHREVPARLKIKGHRPEQLSFMRAPSRIAELDYFREQYKRIDDDPLLQGRVEFEPWGNDVALWYQGVDVILSPSDVESFHFALADGVLTGSLPIVWNWPGSDSVYPADWIVSDVAQAAEQVLRYEAMTEQARQGLRRSNRAILVERYASAAVFERLAEVICTQSDGLAVPPPRLGITGNDWGTGASNR